MSNNTQRPELIYILHAGYYEVVGKHSGGVTVRSISNGFETTLTTADYEEAAYYARTRGDD